MAIDLSLPSEMRRGLLRVYMNAGKNILSSGLVPNRVAAALMENYSRTLPLPRNFRSTPWIGRGEAPESRLVKGTFIRPSHQRTGRTILYFHGGGYHIGSLLSHRNMIHRLACSAESDALYIDYKLAPAHPFPAAIEDAIAAWHALIENGHPHNKIVLAGDSAGGGLAIALALHLQANKKPMPAGIVAFSPWTDLSLSGNSIHKNAESDDMLSRAIVTRWADSYLGGAGRHRSDLAKNPLASPLFGLFHKKFPPVLIQVSRSEILFDDAQRITDKMKAAGVEVTLQSWPGMPHIFQFFERTYPSAETAMREAGQFIQSVFPHN